jgi:micrococcal nuclease
MATGLVVLTGAAETGRHAERAVAPLATRDSLPDSSPPAPADSLTAPCTVFRVDDGDTIECEPQGRVRLLGIDAPERDQPFGTEASEGVRALLPVSTMVRLEIDAEQHDRYGRLLAYLWRDGSLVNWTIVRGGLAFSVRHSPNLRYAEWLDAAEARAAAGRQGIWAEAGDHCRPVDHRRHRC